MDNQATVNNKPPKMISGKFSGERLESRVLEEQIQEAVARGRRSIEVHAFGQHGIGGRLWRTENEPVHIKITGHPGQRVGSMGFPNTFIEVLGPASDDVGWLNAGAEIVIHGNAGNGCANAMAQAAADGQRAARHRHAGGRDVAQDGHRAAGQAQLTGEC